MRGTGHRGTPCWNHQQTGADPTQHKPWAKSFSCNNPHQACSTPCTALSPDQWAPMHQDTHPEPFQLQQNQEHFPEVAPVCSSQQTPALGWVTTGILHFKNIFTHAFDSIHLQKSTGFIPKFWQFSIAHNLRLNLYSIFQEGLHKPAALPIPKPFHLKGGKRPHLKLLAFQSAGICSHLSQSPVDWLPLHTSVGHSCSSDRVIAEHKQSWAESSNRNPGWFHFCALFLY